MITNKKGNIKKTIWLPESLALLASDTASQIGQTLSTFAAEALKAHITTTKALETAKMEHEKKQLIDDLKEFRDHVLIYGRLMGNRNDEQINAEACSYYEDEDDTLRARCKELFGEYPFTRVMYETVDDWDAYSDDDRCEALSAEGKTDEEIKRLLNDEEEMLHGEGYQTFIGYCETKNSEIFGKVYDEIDAFLDKFDV